MDLDPKIVHLKPTIHFSLNTAYITFTYLTIQVGLS